ncbi:MAG: 2-oxo-hepta-3-ene-1,7-dioic acid hydratase [Brucellaceae bacterium]|jgi:2-oxo-hept-3-ene-1,7-dioate hydratase|nr:2-oxo-hepta-3-ene-1,7-dioic acid hydratase [Brucellaceae bacterium]
MLSQAQIAELSYRLDNAEKTKTQIRQFSQEFPDMTIEDAYAIQHAWIQLKLAGGRKILGHKIGLTSKAMQYAVGINEPDYGVLLDDMFYQDGAEIPTERFISTRIEAELAFVLKSRLEGPNCTIFDVLNATDYVTPALEILDTRIERVDPNTGSTRKVFDTISDNAANAALVLGGRPFKPQDIDMRWISAICMRNGQIEETGVAAGVLNNPAYGVAWLANRLAPHGVCLEPGQVILSGSFIRPVDARKGDTFTADYGPFGTVSCYFK